MHPDRREEYLACLALRNSSGLGPRTWKKILEHFGQAGIAVDHVDQWCQLGLASRRQAREFLAGTWRQASDREAFTAMDKGMEVLLWSDADYPWMLRCIPNPPALLYLSGDRGLLASPALAIVGSRKCSRYGLETARAISQEVARAGVCVVSGFAAGIDRQAHVAALQEVGSSIAVLGTGLDLLYPAANKDLWLRLRKQGLIITEFAPGTRPEAMNFPHRNRIISGLSLGVAVVEAAVRSGSLITAAMALEHGREVFALPGPVNMESYDGCHHLIRQGATLVRGGEDILVALQPQLVATGKAGHCADPRSSTPIPHSGAPPGTPQDVSAPGHVRHAGHVDNNGHESQPTLPAHREGLDDEELRLVAVLEHRDKVHIDTICEALEREPASVSTQLLLLEMRSLVMRHPGMYYSLWSK
ncbi:DNA-processing protein DprA [Desulfonatronum thioautotrophicum]|uniref:DNA-processing protein DprA n=1 Tax=Desulfonatronum thioautotrophicum TaxID=617001 RepID=UPI0005EB25A0|nr:DNA-processing protein DprA [Desulfonatronum thioautotrophicum]